MNFDEITVVARVSVRFGVSPINDVFVVSLEFLRLQWETLFGHFVVAIFDLLV